MKNLLNNKKGQGLSVNAIILIILGLVILVMLIFGFVVGWGNLKNQLIKQNNADTIRQGCQTACLTGGTFDYCYSKRELKADDVVLKDVTCNYLAKEQAKYEVESCSSILCDEVVLISIAGNEILNQKCTGNEGKTVQALIGDKLESVDCPTSS